MEYKDSFLGKGWSFPPEFREGKYPTVLVSDEEDIRHSLQILLETDPGERVHRYDFGCGMRRFVYEEMTLTTQTLMKEMIRRAILVYEPRVTLEGVEFDFSREPEGVMDIRLDYTIRMTNTRSNMVYPFYLREGTDVK